MTTPSDERTNRGFRVYDRVPSHGPAMVRVQEASLALEGPHVWLFIDGEECTEHLGLRSRPAPQLNGTQVKRLMAALEAVVADAEADELGEPAEALAPDPNRPLLVNLQDAADELSVTVKALRKWVFDGRLPVVRIGRAVRVRRTDLDLIIEGGLDAVSTVERPVP